ncbi:MAG: four helix bundle protein [Phycisphaerales bacterium]
MGETITSYKDLRVWQSAVEAALLVYELSKAFPREERFGLTSQMRRSAVSVPSNIAEGYGRGTRQEYLRFLRMARGSLFELETQTMLAMRLGILECDPAARLGQILKDTGRILSGLIRSIEGTSERASSPDA